MRLIDADELLAQMIGMNDGWFNPRPAYDNESLIKIQPTVPVIHGRWEGNETCVAYDIIGVKTWAVKRKCSICGFTHKFIEAHMCYEFCPKCGAKMDLENE